MINHNEFLKKILLRELASLKKANHRFSLRLYAQRLGVSSGALSDFLNGKRTFSQAMIRRITEKLNIPAEEKSLLTDSLLLQDQSKLNYNERLLLTKEGAVEVLEMILKIGRKISHLSSSKPGEFPLTLQICCHIDKEKSEKI